MENMDKCAGGVCGGGACHGGCCGGHSCYGGKHHLMKMLLKIIIVMLIFCAGFRLGEVTGFIKANIGGGFDDRGGFGMMRGYYNYAPNTNGAATTPTPTK